ncbi:unnamed protein product, partial [Staurois parvus]
ASVVGQAGSITIGQVGTGGSGREWSGSQARDQTGVVSRGQDHAGSATKTETGMQVTRYRGPWKNTHQGTDCRSGHHLNTPAISLRCLADCRVESLIAESTRWPALVLQPTRQVSPTIIGKSIPDTKDLEH